MRDPRDEVFYQIMPIAWRRGAHTHDEPAHARRHAFGNFRGMIDSVAYLRGLGITAVWLNPIFPSLAYHGYQHDAPDRVNSLLGSEEDFRTFVREAHAAGIRVFLDVVLYGVSDESAFFRESFANPYAARVHEFAFKDAARVRPHGYAYSTWTTRSIGFIHWDLRNPAARARMIECSRRWLCPHHGDDAVDGFRLDHVWAKYPHGPDGWGYNLEFWLEWKDAMKRARPDVWTVAEQGDWRSYGEDLLLAHDAVMSLPLMFAARRSLKAGDATEFIHELEVTLLRTLGGTRVLGVLGNHDVDRLASAIGEGEPDAKGRIRAALAMLLLSPFAPCLYYGDELGLRGKRLDIGGDLNDLPVRQPMPWRAAPDESTSRYHLLNAVGAFEARRSVASGISVEEQAGVRDSALETTRELIALRQRTKALRTGQYRTLRTSSPSVWAFLREQESEVDDGDDPAAERGSEHGSVVGAVNLGPNPIRERLKVPGREDCEVDLAGFAWLVRPAPPRNHATKNRNPGFPPT